MASVLRILSIDGGGIRGIIPAMVLAHIERKTGRPICELFHLIAGTSTGGMIALGLARPRPDGVPMPAEEISQLFRKKGAEVFSRTIWKEVTSLGGVAEQKYDSEPLERLLSENLGNTKLSEAVVDVMATAYDLRSRAPWFFKSWKARGIRLSDGESALDHEFLMRDAARATTAAPTYFEPAKVSNAAGRRFLFVDGGVFANNPAMCAYVSGRRLFPRASRILLLSLSTGIAELRLPVEDTSAWGFAAWARPVLEMIIDGVDHSVHHHLQELLGDDYFRFLVQLTALSSGEPGPVKSLDDASPANLERLVRKAQELLRFEAGKLDSLIERLVGEPMADRLQLGYPGAE